MSTPVIVTMASGRRAKFLVPNQTPVMIIATYITRGQLNEDGTIYVPADFPTPAHFINLDKVINIEIENQGEDHETCDV